MNTKELLTAHIHAMAHCVEIARQAGCMPRDHVVVCIKTGTIWDDVIKHFSPYQYPAVQTVEVAIKVVKWMDLFVHLQAIPQLKETFSEARQEVLGNNKTDEIYPGVALGGDCALHIIIHR